MRQPTNVSVYITETEFSISLAVFFSSPLLPLSWSSWQLWSSTCSPETRDASFDRIKESSPIGAAASTRFSTDAAVVGSSWQKLLRRDCCVLAVPLRILLRNRFATSVAVRFEPDRVCCAATFAHGRRPRSIVE